MLAKLMGMTWLFVERILERGVDVYVPTADRRVLGSPIAPILGFGRLASPCVRESGPPSLLLGDLLSPTKVHRRA